MRDLTLIYPYYMNAGILRKHFDVWNSYPEEIRDRLQVIVVDDASPLEDRAEKAIQDYDLIPNGYRFGLYRILTDLRWNWLQARNIGAHVAKGQWLLLTDIDHIVPTQVMMDLFTMKVDSNCFYTFGRKRMVDNQPYHPHPNSYLMGRKFYWKVGGYDETFAGNYGTDGMYRRRCEKIGTHVPLLDQRLLLVGREVIADASTRPEVLQRKEGRDPNILEEIRSYKEKHQIGIQTLRLPWKKII